MLCAAANQYNCRQQNEESSIAGTPCIIAWHRLGSKNGGRIKTNHKISSESTSLAKNSRMRIDVCKIFCNTRTAPVRTVCNARIFAIYFIKHFVIQGRLQSGWLQYILHAAGLPIENAAWSVDTFRRWYTGILKMISGHFYRIISNDQQTLLPCGINSRFWLHSSSHQLDLSLSAGSNQWLRNKHGQITRIAHTKPPQKAHNKALGWENISWRKYNS